MLNVLNIAYPFAEVSREATGGAEQIVAAIDEGLVQAGHRSVVLACTGSAVAGELVNVDLPTATLTPEVRGQALVRYREVLHRLLERGSFQVAHFHGVDCAGYLPEQMPSLVTLHLPITWYDSTLWSRGNTRFVFVSQAQRDDCPFLAPRGQVIENGVDLAAFQPGPAPDPQGGYFLGIGRICPEKGYHFALRAAHALDRDFILAGRVFPYPEHLTYFAERIAPLLDGRRRFVGAVGGADKTRLLSEAVALVVPSQVAETSSLVTMEALASGTPVIVADQGALPSLIEPGTTGFVAGSQRELERAMADAGELDRLACRMSAEQNFDQSRMVARYLELYEQLASPSQCRAGAA